MHKISGLSVSINPTIEWMVDVVDNRIHCLSRSAEFMQLAALSNICTVDIVGVKKFGHGVSDFLCLG